MTVSVYQETHLHFTFHSEQLVVVVCRNLVTAGSEHLLNPVLKLRSVIGPFISCARRRGSQNNAVFSQCKNVKTTGVGRGSTFMFKLASLAI